MDARNGPSLATFLLTNRLDKGGTQPLTVGEFWQLANSIDNLSTLMDVPADEIAARIDAPDVVAARIHSLLSKGRAAALGLEELEQSGIRMMTVFDDGYPARLRDRLGNTAPPLFYYAGAPSLLETASLAIVGSRHVGNEELNVTRAAAEAAVERGLSVTSGGARGVDQAAMGSAFSEGGVVVGMLADSLLRLLREPDTRRAILDGRAIFLTHQNPSAGFSVGAAMARNKVVYSLADVTFVVAAAAGSGGTWTGAEEALRRNYGRVAAWMGDGRGPGNELLVEHGADPISNVDELFTLEARPAPDAVEQEADQLRLGL